MELANHYLDRPISLPVSCNADRLVRRIQELPIPGEEKLKLLVWAYLGRKDMALGAAVRKAFGAEDCCRYWEERFKRYRVEMPGFSRALEDYLDMGFALEELCRFYSFQEGADEQKRFVQKLLETGLCDNTREMGDSFIDPDQEAPYGIGAVFGQMLQNLTETRVTERFIPIEECKEILLSCMDCPEIIEDCFREYRDSMATKANEPMLAPAKDETEEADTKQYDIFRFDELDSYGSGMRTEPELLAALRKFFNFYICVASEPGFAAYCERSLKERFSALTDNDGLILRDADWEEIYEKMQGSEDHRRFYPAGRVRITGDVVRHAVRVILLNDDLYEMLLDDAEEDKA